MTESQESKSEKFEAILQSAREARQQLTELEHELQGEIDDIDFEAFQRGSPLSEDEKNKRQRLRATQAATRDALVELAYVTLKRIDNSIEVKTLQNRIGQVNKELGEDLDELKGIAKKAEKFKGVVVTMEEVVKGITDFT